jgi:hypothetical protein
MILGGIQWLKYETKINGMFNRTVQFLSPEWHLLRKFLFSLIFPAWGQIIPSISGLLYDLV